MPILTGSKGFSLRKNVLRRAMLCGAMVFCIAPQADVDYRHLPERSCAKAFSSSQQVLFPEESVRLEKIEVSSPAVNLSLAAEFGTIVFNRSGTYKITWFGKAHSPFNVPWTLGFSLDGLIILGNVYGHLGCLQIQNFEGSVVLSINAGQTLQLVNASSHPVELVPTLSHSGKPLASFILQVCLY